MNDKKKMKHVWMIEEASPSLAGQPAKAFWTKIGVAFENDDGSLTLTLAAVPVTGRMIVKDATPLSLGVSTSTKRGVA